MNQWYDIKDIDLNKVSEKLYFIVVKYFPENDKYLISLACYAHGKKLFWGKTKNRYWYTQEGKMLTWKPTHIKLVGLSDLDRIIKMTSKKKSK